MRTSPTRPPRRLRDDRGDAVVALVLATGIVMLLVTQMLNVIVFNYGKGTVRTALDEGARAGARTGSVAVCQETAQQVVDDLIGGALGADVTIRCTDAGRSMVADA